jgi:hypothetical protein
MTPTTTKFSTSHRALIRLNLDRARIAKAQGHALSRRWHVETALSIRSDIRAVASTSRAA